MRSKLISLVLSAVMCASFPLIAHNQETWGQWTLRNWKELSAAAGIGFLINKIVQNWMAAKPQRQQDEKPSKPEDNSKPPHRPEEGENDGSKSELGKKPTIIDSQSSGLLVAPQDSANQKMEALQQEAEMMQREGTGQLMQSEGSASSGSLHSEQEETTTASVGRTHAGIIGEQPQDEIEPGDGEIAEDVARHARIGSKLDN